MTRAPAVTVTVMTHRGLLRPRNEDTVGVGSWLRNVPMEAPEQFVHRVDAALPCLVADGMGGHAGGGVASRIAVSRLAQALGDARDAASLAAPIAGAHQAILDAMDAEPGLEGMGTTLVGLLVHRDGILGFNIGDSRLYRLRDGFLRQISIDHVPDAGWQPGSPDGTVRSGVITRFLGGPRPAEPPLPHVEAEPLEDGWAYLLCSDGLTDLLRFSRISDVLTADTDDVEKVRTLVEQALEAGGTDNISVMLVRIRVGDDEAGA